MGSTFHGLETARRALFAQQSALYTTGHNIANANTEGYSRQRVDLVTTTPFPPAARNRPEIAGQLGTGVEAGAIERVRDQFLDLQYRSENNKVGYWESKATALSQMEDVMNEPSETGLSHVMNQFWNSLQDLSVYPDDGATRSVVVQRGLAVADTFNYLSRSLTGVQNDLRQEMNVTTDRVNSILSQIDGINKQIGEIEPHGYLPNDLYDQRDVLLDELSGIMNINVTYQPSGGNPLKQALGTVNITLADNIGNVLSSGGSPITLLDSTGARELQVGYDNPTNPTAVQDIQVVQKDAAGNTIGSTTILANDFKSPGKLVGLIESHGYLDGGQVKGLYSTMLSDLNQMAFDFASAFNTQHQQGYTLEDANGDGVLDTNGGDFFSNITGGDAAANITVDSSIINDVSKIAAAFDSDGDGLAYAGDGGNALKLADVKENPSVESFYEGMIGGMGIQAQEANRMLNNSKILQQSVERNRQSVSAVSLDEEMTNMIKYQHAYNAAARNMTVVDEILDKIINGMGRVGL